MSATRRSVLAGASASLLAGLPAAAGVPGGSQKDIAREVFALAARMSDLLGNLDGGRWQVRVSPPFQGAWNYSIEPIRRPDGRRTLSGVGLNMDADPWVRLCGERATILRVVAATPLVDGNIPDEVAMPAWDRIAEIDDELGASCPTSLEGVRMALCAFRSEFEDGCKPSEGAIQAMFKALGAMLDGGLT
ncbi:MAG: hypothetical protein J0H11_13660 [Rhizobiales bacterium]|nr:hypothetical protein [Hyphomicrobiales bacterium]